MIQASLQMLNPRQAELILIDKQDHPLPQRVVFGQRGVGFDTWLSNV